MSWRRARFRGDRVYVEVDEAGQIVASGGRVTIRYDARPAARLYRAGADRVQVEPDAAQVELPAGTDPDEAPVTRAAPASRASGFGSAGTRTAAQARAAADHARQRIADLPPGTVIAFTDGSCQGNPGPAGSGAVVLLPDGRRAEASLSLGPATNNVAELSAIGLALDLLDEAAIPPEAPVVIFTDSNYTNGVLTQGWKAKANQELVAGLRLRLRARRGARITWVAGHAGVEGNERADELANEGVAGRTARTPFS